jgi:hypothetical protein
MQEFLAAMKTALRVLTAIIDKREPDLTDVNELRHFAPLLADAPVDDLAREVIQQALGRRPATRKARGAA